MVWQVAAGKVLVQRLDGAGPVAEVSTTLQLAELDVTAGALLLHNGWRAEVLRINDGDGTSTLAAQFEVQGLSSTTAAAEAASAEPTVSMDKAQCGAVAVGPGDGRVSMALHGECVYRTAEGRVEVCSWAGELRGYAGTFNAVCCACQPAMRTDPATATSHLEGGNCTTLHSICAPCM